MMGKSGMCFVVLFFLPLVVFADVPDSSGVRESDGTGRKYIVHSQGMYEGQSIRFRTSSMFKTRKSGIFEEITPDGIRARVLVNRFPGKRKSLLIPYSELESLEIYVGKKGPTALGRVFKGALIGAVAGTVFGGVLSGLEECGEDESLCGIGAVILPVALGFCGIVVGGCVGAIMSKGIEDGDGWHRVPLWSSHRPSPVSRPLSIAFAWKF